MARLRNQKPTYVDSFGLSYSVSQFIGLPRLGQAQNPKLRNQHKPRVKPLPGHEGIAAKVALRRNAFCLSNIIAATAVIGLQALSRLGSRFSRLFGFWVQGAAQPLGSSLASGFLPFERSRAMTIAGLL